VPGHGRLGDKANVALDAHGCPACPHPGIGPAIQGSPDVNVNRRPALRVDDPGVHAACCGKNTWTATKGSLTVFINGKGAHRMGDETRHCGGIGQLVEGSPNVIVGDTTTSPSGPGRSVTPTRATSGSGTLPSSARSGNASASSASLGNAASPDGDALEPGTDLDPTALHLQAQVEVLRVAAAAHTPFCEECERARARSRL
jgi:uncharacterized Zn-binding protein involved in type VI secretion